MGKILKIILAIVVLLVLLALLGGSPEEQKTTTTNTETKTTTTTEQPAAQVAVKQYGIGDRVEVGELAYTITGMRAAPLVGSNDFGARADGIFMIVDMKIENIGTESKTISSSMMKAIDSQGRTFDSDNEAWAHLENNLFLKQAQPGLPVTGQVVFDVPKGEAFSVEVSSGAWSSDRQLIAVGTT